MARPYPIHSGRSRDSPHQRPSAAVDPPFNHSRRSWVDNGVHYTMETASYSSPGMSFSATGGSANGLLNAFFTPQERTARHQAPTSSGFGTRLLGAAVNLLGTMNEMRRASRPRDLQGRAEERRVQFEDSDDDSDIEYDLGYGDDEEGGNRGPRSMLSRLKDKLSDNRQRLRKVPYSREASPGQRSRTGRQASFRSEVHEPADVDLDDEDVGYEAYDKRHQRPRARRTDSGDHDTLDALQDVVEHYRTQVKRSRKDFERASRQTNLEIRILQALVNEVQVCEQSLAAVEQNLRVEKHRTRHASFQNQRLHRNRAPPPTQMPTTPQDQFADFIASTGFGAFSPGQPRAAHPLFPELNDLHSADPFTHTMFGTFHSPFNAFNGSSPFGDDLFHIFGMPASGPFPSAQRKWSQFSRANGSAGSQPGPGFAAFTPARPPKPPATLLSPDEAKTLFKMYNDRWNALSLTDPNIPYPARRLQATALLARHTLWALAVNAQPTTWSEETVMQANAQAFYLGVVDLVPQYSETGGTGRIAMGFDKARAKPTQVKQLVDLLKKEKVRWHSDRLGRRNLGRPGPNEALQNDERARAVFHAVCELMETAQ